MLIKENEATNEIILANDLVGVITGMNEVNIIKNKYNGIVGKVPLFLYKQIEEDFESTETPEDTQDHDDFASFSELNNILNMFNQATKAPKEQVKETANSIKDALEQGGLNLDKIKRELAKRAIKKAAEDKIEEGKEKIKDFGNTLGNFFGEVVDEVEDVVNEVEPRVDQATQDIKDTVESVGIRADLAKLRAVKDFAVEENVATKGFLKKINARIQALETY